MSNMESYIKSLFAVQNPPEIRTEPHICAACTADNRSRVPAEPPLAVLFPTCSEQVQEIVRLANEHHISLAVRSSQGLESTSGASLPAVGAECVAVNLSRMNKIMHIDPKNNMAILEAGVTYDQLNQALKPYGLYCEHPLAPRAEKSVIASLLDRDPVLTAKHLWDVPDPLCCVEMIMGNGALFRTGSAAGPGTLEEMIESGCGINQAQGPVWLDLGRVITGSQGTLAIVTWASVKVRPIGTVSTPAYLQSDDINTLADCVSQIIRRRLGEESVLLNRKGLAQLLGVDPAATANMPQWTYLTTVRGFRFFPERYRDNQLADMADIAGGFGLAVQDSLLGLSNERIAAVLCGSSDKGAYWRQRNGKEILDLFFLSTMDKIGFYSGLAEAAAEKCGLRREDLCVYAQPSQMGRNCHIEFIIQADRETAAKLEKLLGIVLLDNKAFFSRPYGSLVEKIYNRCTDQKTVMPVIKRFFDENNVMNPGRLVYDGGRQ